MPNYFVHLLHGISIALSCGNNYHEQLMQLLSFGYYIIPGHSYHFSSGNESTITLRESVHLPSCFAVLNTARFQSSYLSMLRTGVQESTGTSLLLLLSTRPSCFLPHSFLQTEGNPAGNRSRGMRGKLTFGRHSGSLEIS